MFAESVKRAYAKCIIAGEHSVLRGSSALVFPVKSCFLETHITESKDSFSVEFAGDYGRELSLVFWGVFEEACKRLKVSREQFTGRVGLLNNIPIGGGLGASAAICVSVAREFQRMDFIKTNLNVYELARELENLFHGESSGVDIAASMAESAICFTKGSVPLPVDCQWKPLLYVSYSGVKGVTSDCVSLVKELILRNPDLGKRIDYRMSEAVVHAVQALSSVSAHGIESLATSIDEARSCFEQWGLVNGALKSEMQRRIDQGALAVKPTGSGLGGYVLSLWNSPPKQVGLFPL